MRPRPTFDEFEILDPEFDDGFDVVGYLATHDAIGGRSLGTECETCRHGGEPIPMFKLSLTINKRIERERAAAALEYEEKRAEYAKALSEPCAHVDEWERRAADRKLTAYWQGRAEEERRWRESRLPPRPTEWLTPSVEFAPGLYWIDSPHIRGEPVKVRARVWERPRVWEAPELVEVEVSIWQHNRTNEVITAPGDARMGVGWRFIIRQPLLKERLELPRDWIRCASRA